MPSAPACCAESRALCRRCIIDHEATAITSTDVYSQLQSRAIQFAKTADDGTRATVARECCSRRSTSPCRVTAAVPLAIQTIPCGPSAAELSDTNVMFHAGPEFRCA
jgi:hypothetical protein